MKSKKTVLDLEVGDLFRFVDPKLWIRPSGLYCVLEIQELVLGDREICLYDWENRMWRCTYGPTTIQEILPVEVL